MIETFLIREDCIAINIDFAFVHVGSSSLALLPILRPSSEGGKAERVWSFSFAIDRCDSVHA